MKIVITIDCPENAYHRQDSDQQERVKLAIANRLYEDEFLKGMEVITVDEGSFDEEVIGVSSFEVALKP
jgi:hypothetical protein